MVIFPPTVKPETTRYCLSQTELPDGTISQINEIAVELDINLEQIFVRAISLMHEELKMSGLSNAGDKSTSSQRPMPTGLDRDH